jgi:CheY-like chemotaxis protein
MHQAARRPALLRLCCASLLALAAALPAADDAGMAADTNIPQTDQVRDLLAEGVRQYRVGRYGDAAATFRSAVALAPEHRLAYEFYLACGEPLVMAMEAKAEMEDVLKDIRRRANIYRTELRRDVRYIDLMIAKLTGGEDERVAAQYELIGIGPLAVPHLVARLGDNRQDTLRAACRITLTRMGYRAVLPLHAALDATDQRLVATTAAILADIGDPRSVAPLKRIAETAAEEATREVAANAITAIAARSGADPSPAAADLAAAEALRYYRGGDEVRKELIANESLVWRWDAGAGDGATAQLTAVVVPRYAWNELVAEELLHIGMRTWPAHAGFGSLLAATLAAQVTEADARASAAKESVLPITGPDEGADAIAARITALGEQLDRVRMAGPERLYRATDIAIRSETYATAVTLMQLLEDRALAQAARHLPTTGFPAEMAGTVLVAALEHPEKRVRYQAATTLATLDPNIAYTNRDLVVPTLAQAVGESGVRVVLVVDPDFRYRNQARAQLQSRGYLCTTAGDGHAALQRLKQTPVVDAIILSGELQPTLTGAHGETIDVPEQTAPTLVAWLRANGHDTTPLFISLPENPELAVQVKAAFADTTVGFLAKPFAADVMAGSLQLALETAQAPNRNRDLAEAIALRAARALAVPDAERTALDLPAAAEALVLTLENRADPLRIAAAAALARLAAHANADVARALAARIVGTYRAQDAELPAPVRAALLGAIGTLGSGDADAVGILQAALVHTDPDVRAAAHAAVGHAAAQPADVQADFQRRQRLDVRAPGNGAAAP